MKKLLNIEKCFSNIVRYHLFPAQNTVISVISVMNFRLFHNSQKIHLTKIISVTICVLYKTRQNIIYRF